MTRLRPAACGPRSCSCSALALALLRGPRGRDAAPARDPRAGAAAAPAARGCRPLVADPQLMLLEAGLPGPGLSDPPHRAWTCCCCSPAGPAAAAGPRRSALLLAALAALLRPAGRRPVVIGWVLALVGLARPLVQSRVRGDRADRWRPRCRPGPDPPCCSPVPAWSSRPPSGPRVRATGWRAAASAGGSRLRRSCGPGRASLPLAAAGWWAVAGAGDPLDRRDPVLLPAFVAAEGDRAVPAAHAGAAPRPAGDLAYALLRAEGPRTGDAELAPPADATPGLDAWSPTWPPAAAATRRPGWSPTASGSCCSPTGRPRAGPRRSTPSRAWCG